MYLTVTLNSALDRVIFIEEFQPETVMRTPRQVTSVGGKGFDTSVVLRALAQETVAVGLMAGLAGEMLARLLESYGIQPDLIWVNGETRIAHVIVETLHHRHSHIMTGGLSATPQDFRTLLTRTEAHLSAANWLICAGSQPANTPPDTLQRLVQAAKEADVHTLIDSSGPSLELAAEASPTILKMNRSEMMTAFKTKGGTLKAIAAEAQHLRETKKLENLIITCGGDGILAITPESTWHSFAPRQEPVNAAGAGDAVSAAVAYRLTEGDSWEGALRWAAAVSAAVVRTPGTADCDMATIQEILPSVTTHKLD